MKNLLLIASIGLASFNLFANDLYTTKLKGNSEPTVKEVQKAINVLTAANKTASVSGRTKLLAKARKLIAKKTGMVTYKAAIVIGTNYGDINLADYEGYLEDNKSICYNGDINVALEVANTLSSMDSFWIYDEYSLDSIEISGSVIEFKVMDEFSYSDQDASEEDRDDFITTYSAAKCK